jgi:son of sevenless
MNNFSGLMSIISALNSTPVHRLKRTWEMVPSKSMLTFDDLNKVMHSTMNFSVYREKIHTVSLPCLPFLGVYLSDLTFIEDGNPNMLRNNENMINFSKRMKTAEVIRDLQQYQMVPYSYQRVPELQSWVDNELFNSSEISDLYDLSTQVEPREREDEKMYAALFALLSISARLLQESGFL